MFETGVTRKITADSRTTQHLIANRDLIRDYYGDYSEYQTGSGEVLPSYGKGTLLLPWITVFIKRQYRNGGKPMKKAIFAKLSLTNIRFSPLVILLSKLGIRAQ